MPIVLALGNARPVVEMKPPLTDKSECLVAIALTLLRGVAFVSNTQKKRTRSSSRKFNRRHFSFELSFVSFRLFILHIASLIV